MKFENNRLKFFSWSLTKPKTTDFFTFLLLSIIMVYIGFEQNKLVKDEKQSAMRNALYTIHQNIEQSLKNYYTSTFTLGLTINDAGVPKNFDSIAKKLLQSNHTISAVQLVPKGVLRYIYTMKDNEAARGLNILNSLYLKKAALKSIQNQKMYFADPLKLKQGGAGTLGRLPVLQDNEFSGFSAEISKLKDLLKSSGSYNIDRSKYYFQFTKINPTTKKKVYYLPKETKYSKNCSVSLFMADGDGNYTLRPNIKTIYIHEF